MRQNDGWIKLLIVILALVLTGLLGFTAFEVIGDKKDGGYRAVKVPESTDMAETPGMDDALAGETPGRSDVLPGETLPGETEEVSGGTEPGAELAAMEEDGKRDTDPETVTLLFAGDVLLSNHVLNAYDKAGGIWGVLDEGIRRQIDEADIFMVNQEFPFSNRGTAAEDKQYTFRLPPSRVNLLKEMGIQVVTMANNHILDFGTDPLIDSGTTLDSAGIAYVGAGENLERAKQLVMMEAGGKTIGYLGASRVYMDASWAASGSRPGVLSTYDPKELVEEIEAARSLCDYLVVYVHWGIERDTEPQEYQRTLGKAYIDAGADLVVGSHPHVLQGVEYYKGKPIVYSLGNFVFGSSIPKTALLKVELDGEETRLSMIPCTSAAGYTRLLEGEGKIQEFYRYMTELSWGVSFEEEGNVVPQ